MNDTNSPTDVARQVEDSYGAGWSAGYEAAKRERPDDLPEIREQLAAYAHDAWSGWMRYQKEKAPEARGSLPEWARDRWTRQMTTAYADLPESEKESDRAEADKMLAIMRPAYVPTGGTTASDSMRVEKRPADEEAEIAAIRERQAHGVEDCPVCGEDLGATRDRAALLVARDESRRIRVADLAMMQNAYEERLEELKAERDALAVRCERLRVALKGIDPMFDNDSPLLTAYKREIEAVRAEGGWK